MTCTGTRDEAMSGVEAVSGPDAGDGRAFAEVVVAPKADGSRAALETEFGRDGCAHCGDGAQVGGIRGYVEPAIGVDSRQKMAAPDWMPATPVGRRTRPCARCARIRG